MSIKKAYQAIISTLEANREELVSDILPTIIELASAKTGGGGGKATSFHRAEDGTIAAIHCFYHKVWIAPSLIEFGAKASSATGLNSMCKSGVSNWTKQQRSFKKGKEDLLTQVASGDIEATAIQDYLAELEEAKNIIVPIDGDYQGFETLDECLEDLANR